MNAKELMNPNAPAKKGLAIAGLIALVLAGLLGFVPTLINALVNLIDGMRWESFSYSIGGNFGGVIASIMAGLFLPVALLLLGDHPNPAGFAKVFMIVSIAFLVVQLLSALIAAIYVLAELEYSGFIAAISRINGSWLLATPLGTLKCIIDGYMDFGEVLLELLSNLFSGLSDLLFLVVNGICAFGFFKLSK